MSATDRAQAQARARAALESGGPHALAELFVEQAREVASKVDPDRIEEFAEGARSAAGSILIFDGPERLIEFYVGREAVLAEQ